MLYLKSLKVNLVLDGFAQADLRPSTLILAMNNEKKNYFNSLGEIISTIKNYMTNSFHPLFKEKTVLVMWSILESCFWHVSPMSISAVFSHRCTKKSADFKSIVDYTSNY